MNTNHTPGPWIATDTTTRDYNAVGDTLGIGIRVEADGCGHRWHVANVFGQMDESKPLATDHGYAQANARLIAAAPEMLHALKLAAEELNKMGCECDCEASPVCCPVCAVNDAIAKALTEP